MKDTITLPRSVVERALSMSVRAPDGALYYDIRAALDAPPTPEDPMLACDIAPRPLEYPLSHYHLAIGGGPLHFTWKDKPHRLVYDLIAAVKYYAQQPAPTAEPQRVPLTEDQIDKVWQSVDFAWRSRVSFARAIEAAHQIRSNEND